MPRFKKKSAEVEALQYTGDSKSTNALMHWAHAGKDPALNAIIINHHSHLAVRMQDGFVTASTGDWIVKDSWGVISVWKSPAFEAAYVPMLQDNITVTENGGVRLNTSSPEVTRKLYSLLEQFRAARPDWVKLAATPAKLSYKVAGRKISSEAYEAVDVGPVKEFFMTIGVGYEDGSHPLGLSPFGYVVIEASDYTKARQKAFELTEGKFAFLYPERPEAKYLPLGELLRVRATN